MGSWTPKTKPPYFFREGQKPTSSFVIKKISLGIRKISRFKGSVTLQGDPRALVFIAGTKIGQFLGFKLVDSAEFVELHVPQIHFLKTKLSQINTELVRNGKEPIDYELVKTGLASSRQIVGLSKVERQNEKPRGRGQKFSFPFDDSDPLLLVHEYSFHLAPLLFPGVVLKRAGLVSERVLELIELLNQPKGLHPLAKMIIEERAHELDFGTGRINVSLTTLAQLYYPLNFQEILQQKMHDEYFKRIHGLIKGDLDYLTKNQLPPAFAALGLLYMFSRLPSEEVPYSIRQNLQFSRNGDVSFGAYFEVPVPDRPALIKIVRDYLSKFEIESSLDSASTVDPTTVDVDAFLNGVADRRRLIESAIDRIVESAIDRIVESAIDRIVERQR